jgi:heme exporter protein B
VNAFGAIVARDLKLAFRAGGEAFTLVLFFVMIAAIVPFAVGPDRATLSRLAPGIVWIAAFLSMLLGLDRIFRADAEDGSLLLFGHASIPLEAVVAAKLIAHWLATALPLIVVSPVLAILLSMDVGAWGRATLALLCGTPALVAFGTVGAAVTVGLPRGGVLAAVLLVPLALPVVIFGVGAIGGQAADAALLLLIALSLVTLAFGPFAAALALRTGQD